MWVIDHFFVQATYQHWSCLIHPHLDFGSLLLEHLQTLRSGTDSCKKLCYQASIASYNPGKNYRGQHVRISNYTHLNVITSSKISLLSPLINVEYHENWLLVMSTTNYIEQHWEGGSYQSHQRQADLTLSLESVFCPHNFCQDCSFIGVRISRYQIF